MLRVPVGTTDQSITIQIVDDSGLPVTGLVAATFPAITYDKGANAAAVAIGLSDLSAITDGHADGGVYERSGGRYRLDLPDAVCSAAALVTLTGEATDKRLIAPAIQVGPVPADALSVEGTDASDALETAAENAIINQGVVTAAELPANFDDLVISVGDGEVVASNMRGTDSALLAAGYTAPDNAGVASIETKVDTLLARITSTLFSGITSLGNWLRAGFRSDFDDATAEAEINSGGGAFDPAFHALENIFDEAAAAGSDAADAKTAAEAVSAKLPTSDYLAGSSNPDGSIDATVEGEVEVGSLSAAALAQLTSLNIAPQVFLNQLIGRIELVKGDAHTTALGRPLQWDQAAAETWWPDLSGADSLRFAAKRTGETNLSVAATATITGESGQQVTADLSSSDTDITAGDWKWELVALFSSNEVTLRRGKLKILDEVE